MSKRYTIEILAVIGVLSTLAVMAFLFNEVQKLKVDVSWVDHTHRVVKNLDSVLRSLDEAESAKRGYLITDDNSFLDAYDVAKKETQQLLASAEARTQDNPDQQAEFAGLQQLIIARLEQMEDTIKKASSGNREEAWNMVKTNEGTSTKIEIEQVIERMNTREEVLLLNRTAIAEESFQTSTSLVWLAGLISSGCIIGLYLASHRLNQLLVGEKQQLLESETRLRTTLASIGDAVVTTDLAGQVMTMNTVAEDMTGWRENMAQGKPLSTVVDITSEATGKALDNPATLAIKSGKPVELSNHTILHSRSGRTYHIEDCAAPILDDSGQIIGCVLVFRDSTDQRLAQQQIEESERHLRAVINQSPTPVIVHDSDGRIVQVSDSWKNRNGDHVPQSIWDLYRSRGIELSDDAHAQLLMSNEELTFEDDQGTKITWLVDAFTLGASSGLYVVAGRDITERVEAVAGMENAMLTAEAASRSRGEFLANMSHEIRTPMTAIIGHAEILASDEVSEERREQLQVILGNAKHLLTIINDILDLSKIDAGQLQPEFSGVSPASVMSDIYSLMQVSAKAKELSLQIDFLGLVPETIYTDPVRLRQILINLIGNAIKFTDQGSVKIQINYLANDNALQIAVRDTGSGISPKALKRLFQPFEQGDASNTRQYGGTGLGLAISQRLAHALGGEITIQSIEGEGSVFTLTIDCGDTNDAKLIQASMTLKTAGETQIEDVDVRLDCDILIADDSRDIVFLLKHFLTKAGARVEVATNGRECLEIYDADQSITKKFSVIILDMQMPIMDGYTAAAELRKRGCELPIIALTANAMVEDRQKCIDSGCNDYCTKPINSQMLLGKVLDLITQQSQST